MLTVHPLTFVLAEIGKLQALPPSARVTLRDHNEHLLDALRIDPANLPADVAEWAANLASQLPPGTNGAVVAAYLAGAEYDAVEVNTLLVAYAVALLADAYPLIGALDLIGRLTAPPVFDPGDTGPAPDVAPAVLTQTGDVVGGGE